MRDVVMLEDNAVEVLSYWELKPGDWQVIGFVTSALEAISRPILRIGGERYILLRQPPDLGENDTLFRHALIQHLGKRGLPAPDLLARPDGHTYAIVEDGIYELQQYRDGERYVTGGADDDDQLEAAARALGRLHQASAGFEWQAHAWPEERSDAAIGDTYTALIRQASEREALTERVRAGLARIAESCEQRLDTAFDALSVQPLPPLLHIHGDYQPHNLAFDVNGVAAIYDFDAARWERRIDELAYSLLYFAGVRWDETPTVTPPLTDDGLDVLRAHRYLAAYGDEAPPAEGEARLLGDALALAFPVVFANGVADDLIYPDDYAEPPDEQDALARIEWAERFWLWLDRYRDTLAEAWEGA